MKDHLRVAFISPDPTMHPFFTFRQSLPPVRRLGLATRGNTHLTQDDVWLALHAGINYWNWCGHEDGMASDSSRTRLKAQRCDDRYSTGVARQGRAHNESWKRISTG